MYHLYCPSSQAGLDKESAIIFKILKVYEDVVNIWKLEHGNYVVYGYAADNNYGSELVDKIIIASLFCAVEHEYTVKVNTHTKLIKPGGDNKIFDNDPNTWIKIRGKIIDIVKNNIDDDIEYLVDAGIVFRCGLEEKFKIGDWIKCEGYIDIWTSSI